MLKEIFAIIEGIDGKKEHCWTVSFWSEKVRELGATRIQKGDKLDIAYDKNDKMVGVWHVKEKEGYTIHEDTRSVGQSVRDAASTAMKASASAFERHDQEDEATAHEAAAKLHREVAGHWNSLRNTQEADLHGSIARTHELKHNSLMAQRAREQNAT